MHGNTAHNWHWHRITEHEWQAVGVANGTEYLYRFRRYKAPAADEWTLHYHRRHADTNDRATWFPDGSGNAVPVYAIMLAAIFSFLDLRRPLSFTYEAHPAVPSQRKLYAALGRAIARRTGIYTFRHLLDPTLAAQAGDTHVMGNSRDWSAWRRHNPNGTVLPWTMPTFPA